MPQRNCAELVKYPGRFRIVETKDFKYPLPDKYLIAAIISVPGDTDKSEMRNVIRQKLNFKTTATNLVDAILEPLRSNLNEGETENANT